MGNKSITVESLHAEYAGRLAAVVGLSVAGYQATADGLASLLLDTAGRLGPTDHSREWLGEAAAELEAVSRLGGEGRVSQELFKRADRNMYEALEELETY